MEVIYEDNHIIIVNKQSGEIVQGDKTGDRPLSDIVKDYIKEKYQKPGAVFLGVAHRLDRPVSGLVVFARTSKALARLNKMFAEGEVHKTYWAIVPKESGVRSQESGEWHTLENWLVRNEKQNKSYAYDHERPNAKKAILRYRAIGQSERYTLLEVNLMTGRRQSDDRPPPSDPLPIGSDGLSNQGRPEIRCPTFQPRRLDLSDGPPRRVHPSRFQSPYYRRGTRPQR